MQCLVTGPTQHHDIVGRVIALGEISMMQIEMFASDTAQLTGALASSAELGAVHPAPPWRVARFLSLPLVVRIILTRQCLGNPDKPFSILGHEQPALPGSLAPLRRPPRLAPGDCLGRNGNATAGLCVRLTRRAILADLRHRGSVLLGALVAGLPAPLLRHLGSVFCTLQNLPVAVPAFLGLPVHGPPAQRTRLLILVHDAPPGF